MCHIRYCVSKTRVTMEISLLFLLQLILVLLICDTSTRILFIISSSLYFFAISIYHNYNLFTHEIALTCLYCVGVQLNKIQNSKFSSIVCAHHDSASFWNKDSSDQDAPLTYVTFSDNLEWMLYRHTDHTMKSTTAFRIKWYVGLDTFCFQRKKKDNPRH